MNDYRRQLAKQRRSRYIQAAFTWAVVVVIGLAAAVILHLAVLSYLGIGGDWERGTYVVVSK